MKNLLDLFHWLWRRYTFETLSCNCRCAGGHCPHILIAVYDWPRDDKGKMRKRQISRYVICRN